MMETALTSLSAAVFVYLVFLLLFDRSSEDKIKKRLDGLVADRDMDGIHDDVIREKQKRISQNKRSGLISRKLEDSLTMAGVKLNAKEYLCAWAGAVFLPSLLLLALGRNPVSALGAGAVGFAIPPVLVQRSKKKRQDLFNKQLGQSLVIMSNSIKSGYSFQQAMQSIASDMQPPISTEFEKTLREMRYGVRQEEALDHLVERAQNQDLGLLISAVATSAQVGSNLSEIIDNISVTITDRVKIRDEVRNLSAQGRISGLIIGLLPVVLFLMLMVVNPSYILSFFEETAGKIMIAVGVALEVIGFLVINKIVDIKY
ncbi:MAG TPA: type II secretion system F family protein [Caproiciproducens sp.]|jgi:Flp pilus assembly protein TadB|nr:type II secretion system F family protein [Caproiciproducens sp.]